MGERELMLVEQCDRGEGVAQVKCKGCTTGMERVERCRNASASNDNTQQTISHGSNPRRTVNPVDNALHSV